MKKGIVGRVENWIKKRKDLIQRLRRKKIDGKTNDREGNIEKEVLIKKIAKLQWSKIFMNGLTN